MFTKIIKSKINYHYNNKLNIKKFFNKSSNNPFF